MSNWFKSGRQFLIKWLEQQLALPSEVVPETEENPPKEKKPTYYLQERFTIDGYQLSVLEFKQEEVWDTAHLPTKYVPSVRILVEYSAESGRIVEHKLFQWMLYDKEGYGYEPEIYPCFYGVDAKLKLERGTVGENRQVRGWVAFHTAGIKPDYVQFRKDYSTKWAVDIKLEPSLSS
jgi:hypothetical protein